VLTKKQACQWGNFLELAVNGSLRGTFNDVNGNYTAVSDRRLKTSITPLPNDILTKVMALNPVSYLFKDQKNDKESIGFIAQEIELIFPGLVHKHAQKDDEQLLSLSYSEFGVIAIKAIQEQQRLIEDLEKEIMEVKILQQELISLKAEINNSLGSVNNNK